MPASLARRYYREFAGARTILDVGCGTGDFGRLRPSPGVVVNGVDSRCGRGGAARRSTSARCASIWTRCRCRTRTRASTPCWRRTSSSTCAIRAPGARGVSRSRRGGVLVASVVMATAAAGVGRLHAPARVHAASRRGCCSRTRGSRRGDVADGRRAAVGPAGLHGCGAAPAAGAAVRCAVGVELGAAGAEGGAMTIASIGLFRSPPELRNFSMDRYADSLLASLGRGAPSTASRSRRCAPRRPTGSARSRRERHFGGGIRR